MSSSVRGPSFYAAAHASTLVVQQAIVDFGRAPTPERYADLIEALSSQREAVRLMLHYEYPDLADEIEGYANPSTRGASS